MNRYIQKLKILLAWSCLFYAVPALAQQSSIGIQYFGLSIHPFGDENAFLMPNKLDSRGVLVLNIGAALSYEHYLAGKDRFSVKVIQALYADCAARAGGFSHIGIRHKVFKTEKHSLYGGIGPTLVYRRNWQELTDYQNPGFFRGATDARWQYRMLWIGGEFEYSYKISPALELTTMFVPGFPQFMSLSAGVKYWLPSASKVFKKRDQN
jgi:hypothetical protein